MLTVEIQLKISRKIKKKLNVTKMKLTKWEKNMISTERKIQKSSTQ